MPISVIHPPSCLANSITEVLRVITFLSCPKGLKMNTHRVWKEQDKTINCNQQVSTYSQVCSNCWKQLVDVTVSVTNLEKWTATSLIAKCVSHLEMCMKYIRVQHQYYAQALHIVEISSCKPWVRESIFHLSEPSTVALVMFFSEFSACRIRNS